MEGEDGPAKPVKQAVGGKKREGGHASHWGRPVPLVPSARPLLSESGFARRRIAADADVADPIPGNPLPPARASFRLGAADRTLYREEYCDLVVSFCREGYSLTGFAGHIGVSRAVLVLWRDKYPEFAAAIDRAKAAAALAYEKMALEIAKGNGGPGASQMVAVALRAFAPDDWADKSKVEVDHRHSLSDLVAASMARLEAPGEQKDRQKLIEGESQRVDDGEPLTGDSDS